jgi:KaiC/GvpD/RAD55 family RecA-like ATPase
MASLLIITPVETLQEKVNHIVKSFKDMPGIYVSLNKTQKSMEEIFKKSGINPKKLFFIDCVTSKKTRDDVLHIAPDRLDLLDSAVSAFIEDIKGERFLIIDALSTLLIYNNEDSVAKFVKKMKEYASQNNMQIVALSPKTKGEELLNKIFNFFDKVEGK